MKSDPSAPRRSLLKGLSWETVSLFLTFAIAWMIFGQVETCIMFAFISFAVKLVGFYCHERFWHQIKWGKET